MLANGMANPVITPWRATLARRTSGALLRVQKTRLGADLVRTLRTAPGIGAALRNAIGFRGAFPTAKAASAAAAGVVAVNQDVEDNIALHLRLAESPRKSDPDAMRALAPMIAQSRSLFDLGGNVGNLFYLYARSIEIPADFVWNVCELPHVVARGREIARERGEQRLHFTDAITDMRKADILFVSGALHYWRECLPDLMIRHDARPAFVVINRTPFSAGPEVHVIQDAGAYFASCTLHPRTKVFAGMEALGYALMRRWDAPDLSLGIPGWPELSVSAYEGAAWRRVD